MATKKIKIAERELEIRPTSLKRLEEDLLPAMGRISKTRQELAKADASDPEAFMKRRATMYSDMAIIVHAGLVRSDDSLTVDWIRENIDAVEIDDLLVEVLIASGLREAKPGEATSP